MKKFIPYILIMAIVGGFLLSVVPPPREAEGVAPVGIVIGGLALWQLLGHSIGIPTPIDLTIDFAKMSLSYILAGISWFFFQMASVIVSISGYLFDIAVEKSITLNEFIKGITTPDGRGAIDVGWAASRDVVNLFFIFILLYIAIATILQLSGYGIKDLLVRVIIIALLVNFSLLATKVIIDASNILALKFYNNIKVKIEAPDDDPGGKFKKGDEIYTNSPALIFTDVLKFQTIFKAKGRGISGFIEKADKFDVALVLFLGTIVLLVVAFVFCAMAVLFIIRSVALIFLMVISPLAFLAMALPATKGYASQWWTKLFKQAFFAPFCLFLLYLSAMIVSSPGFVNITDSDDASFALALSGQSSHFGIIFSYILVIGLLIGSLLVAKEMGAYGADTAIKLGKSAKKWGQGYAGKISKRGAGYLAEKSIDEKSWINRKTGGKFAQSLNLMPGATRGLARASSWREQQIKEKQKKYAKIYGSYSPAGLAAMTQREFGAAEIGLATIGQGPRITEAKRKAIEDVKKEKREKAKKIARQDELRRVADDQSQGATARLAAMKLLGELDVQTELEKTKEELEKTKGELGSEKAKSSAAKEGGSA